jgi:hypothetical protein
MDPRRGGRLLPPVPGGRNLARGELVRGPRPFVLGLPFSFFWPALWIVLGGVALALLDGAEERAARASRGDSGSKESA